MVADGAGGLLGEQDLGDVGPPRAPCVSTSPVLAASAANARQPASRSHGAPEYCSDGSQVTGLSWRCDGERSGAASRALALLQCPLKALKFGGNVPDLCEEVFIGALDWLDAWVHESVCCRADH